MVSRLFTSLSGMLGSSKDHGEELPVEDIDKANENDKKNEAALNNPEDQPRKPNMTKGNIKGLEILDAESLDRAIVHRLQSRHNTSSLEESATNIVERDLVLHSDSMECGLECRLSVSDTRKGRLSRENSIPGTHKRSRSRSRSNSRGSILRAVMEAAEEIPEDQPSLKDSFKKFVDGLDSLDPEMYTIPQITSEEKRNVVYKNSQFNLENASKEALVEPTNVFPKADVLSDTLLHLPLFGIPDPSMYRRPSVTSSTESVRGTGVVGSRTSFVSERKKGKKAKSPTRGYRKSSVSKGLSMSQIGDKLFEETMNEIIEKGGDDFKTKYSSWVWEAFRSHLVKMKSLLLSEFSQKMKDILDEREQEVAETQKQYRDKLAEFDLTTEGYQKMIENLHQENVRILKAKDFIIEKLKKEFLECKKHFEQDLLRQMQSYRQEAEVEKLELQKRNDELMTIMLTDASKCGLEEAFRREIESLHKMIKTLTSQNEMLHKQVNEITDSTSVLSQKAVETVQTQLEVSKLEVMELRKKLQYSEREKEDLTVSHHEEIAKLNRKMQENNTRYDHRLREAAEEMEELRKKHAKDTKDLKLKLTSQELQYSQALNQVKLQYGGQVESLSKIVSQLQAELTISGTCSKFS